MYAATIFGQYVTSTTPRLSASKGLFTIFVDYHDDKKVIASLHLRGSFSPFVLETTEEMHIDHDNRAIGIMEQHAVSIAAEMLTLATGEV